jgi:UDP-N-acetylmuramate dehydrogenase
MKVSCALYIEIEAEEDLLTLDWSSLPQPVMVLGGGSNLLFTKDFPGTVLHVSLCHCERSEESWTCGAGVVFDDFCAWAASEGLWGPENLSLIPGECGASAVQNIGAYGVEAKDIIADIRAYDRKQGQFVHIDPATCAYGYRTSRFKTDWKGRYIITAVTYRLSKDPKPVLDYGGIRKALEVKGVSVSSQTCATLTPLTVRETIIEIRNQKLPDPAVTGSAGSFFCNPVVPEEVFNQIAGDPPHFVVDGGIKIPAAWLIEQCGFKGARLGGAQVYQKQPLVIVNATGEASPEDIIGLEKQVIDAVKAKFGITLHPEVEHV